MAALKWVLAMLVATGVAYPGAAQSLTPNQRLIQLAEVLSNASSYSTAAKIRAIQEIGDSRVVSGVASGLLFNRANYRFEPDPAIREQAALNIQYVCELNNRMGALRLAHFAVQANEPEPLVRIAALRSLAAFESADAASAVFEATKESAEPDPAVRTAAKELVQKGLAGSIY